MRRPLITPVALALCALAPALADAQTTGVAPLPIPKDANNGSVAPFTGSNAVARPVHTGSSAQNPFMAPNGRNNIHNDAYMTDTYRLPGPLGDGEEVSALFSRECASVTFDSQGRIVTICVGVDRPVLALLDPQTLTPLATMPLPFRNAQSVGNLTSDFSGGGYFFLDHHDRAVFPTNDRHILEVAITPAPGAPSFTTTRDYDLSGALGSSDGIISVLPDWRGRLWFVTRGGVVGTVDRNSGAVRTLRLDGEGISNSFAVDETGGVFIVSDRALYRFGAAPDGGPKVVWRVTYPDSGVHKPGQSDAGSGTTPTLMGRGGKGWVAITDNADPMNVQVYRRGKRLGPSRKRARKLLSGAGEGRRGALRKQFKSQRRRSVCHRAVFPKGGGSTDQSLIGTSRSLVAENNYGYSGVTATMTGGVTSPGLARVDVVSKRAKHGRKAAASARGRGRKRLRCRLVWTSQERAPSVVPKLSLDNGLVYTYTKPPQPNNVDAWYLTTLDFRTGRTIYSRLAGSGFGYNNNFAPVTLSRTGTAYVGVLGGIVAFR
jgi:hypothetical protein